MDTIAKVAHKTSHRANHSITLVSTVVSKVASEEDTCTRVDCFWDAAGWLHP
jgi:hypothetical protein